MNIIDNLKGLYLPSFRRERERGGVERERERGRGRGRERERERERGGRERAEREREHFIIIDNLLLNRSQIYLSKNDL